MFYKLSSKSKNCPANPAKQSLILVCWACIFLILSKAQAAVNDVFPGDYVPGQAGMSAFSTYLYSRELTGLYINGQLNKSRRLRSDTSVFLTAHYFDWLNQRMLLSLSGGWSTLSMTTLATGEVIKNSGMFDPKVSWTIWPLLNQEQGRYLSFGFSFVPGWGDYDPSLGGINAGQNRYRGVAYLAWSSRVAKTYVLEATAEQAIYGANPNFGPNAQRLEQSPAPALTGYVRHNWRPNLSPYIGVQLNFGGERKINGVTQEDSLRSDRAMLGVRWTPAPKQIVNFRLSHDTRVDHGFKLDHEWALRWTYMY